MIKKYNEMFENKNENQRLNWGCAVVIDDKSRSILAKELSDFYEMFFDLYNWKKFSHHMTIAFGKGLGSLGLEEDEGKEVKLTVTHLGVNKMVFAVKVEGYPSTNDNPHITIAVNTQEGGKPVMSNNIDLWRDCKPFELTGIVTEMKQKK